MEEKVIKWLIGYTLGNNLLGMCDYVPECPEYNDIIKKAKGKILPTEHKCMESHNLVSRWSACEKYRDFFAKQAAEELKNLEKLRKGFEKAAKQS